MRPFANPRLVSVVLIGAAICLGVACSDSSKAPPTKTEVDLDPGVYTVNHPELFELVGVSERSLPMALTANGAIAPDVNSTIHVTSQGAGRVVDLKVRMGDYVHKGQELLSIYSTDLAGAFADYQKAIADERLANKALDRAQMLYSHGAAASKDLEQAEDAEEKAKVDVQNAEQHIRILGGDPAHPSSTIVLRAPVSGVIVEQNISGFEGIKSLDNSPNLFTIADLSHVWVLCDVYENDLGEVHRGDPAEIHLNAYPGKVFRGRVVDISRVLDPNLRSAKVRIVLPNADVSLKPGMYVMATFHSMRSQSRLVVPSAAVMRLQDKDWVFRREDRTRFRRLEVRAIGATTDGLEQIEGEVKVGDQVVGNALSFSSAAAQEAQ